MLAGLIPPAELAELAGRGGLRQLRLELADLPRLATAVRQGSPGELEAAAQFRRGPGGLPAISLAVRGHLVLECQRCLGPLEWPVDVAAELVVVPAEADAGLLEDPFDAVTAGAEGLALAHLAEDEVLAALPLAPAHADQNGCAAPAAAADASGETNRPLAGLAGLLKASGPTNAN